MPVSTRATDFLTSGAGGPALHLEVTSWHRFQPGSPFYAKRGVGDNLLWASISRIAEEKTGRLLKELAKPNSG